jgi:hypothetical protein
MKVHNRKPYLGSIGLVLSMMLLGTAPVEAGMSADELSQTVAARYNVEVLKVLPANEVGEDIVAVRVMNPRGNSNGALQVYTIFVNAETGEFVPRYGELVSRLSRTSPLIWQRTVPFTVED